MADNEKKKITPTEKDSNDAVWEFAFAVEQELKRVGCKIEETGIEGGREYYLVQNHGPFPTRGEALMHALRAGLVCVKKA